MLFFLSSCRAEAEVENATTENLVTKTITLQGGSVETSDGIKITFPAGTMPENTEVSIGYTGNEPTTISNPNVNIIGKPFTVKIAQDSLLKTVIIEIPKPEQFTNNQQISIFIKNGNEYFPLFYEVEGNMIKAKLDILNFTKSYNSTLNKGGGTFVGSSLIISILKDMQSPNQNEMGLKKITTDNNGNLVFSDLPTLNSNDKVLLFVHGWMSNPSNAWKDFHNLIKPLVQQAGYTHFATYGYNSGIGINGNGQLLANSLQSKLNGAKLDIVGHSMGGLVSRSAIENHNASSLVNNLVTLGTPHKGSPLAASRYFLGFLIGLNNPLSLSSYSMDTQGFKDLNTTSEFITNLNNNPQSSVSYYAIGAENSPCEGTLLGLCWPPSFYDILPGNDDGVVATTSALGILNNNSYNFLTEIAITNHMAHTKMTSNLTVAQNVALYLRKVNPPASSNPYLNSSLTYGSVTDIDGNTYATIKIGTQTWMAENLKTSKYNDGAVIPNITSNTDWLNITTGAWSYPNNDASYNQYYGKLYKWRAVNTGKLCPQGWHIPTDDEWSQLTNFLGGVELAGGKLKSAGLWASPNSGATNQSGFSGLPSGERSIDGVFYSIGYKGHWWSSTMPSGNTNNAWSREVGYNYSNVYRLNYSESYGLSCRCIKN